MEDNCDHSVRRIRHRSRQNRGNCCQRLSFPPASPIGTWFLGPISVVPVIECNKRTAVHDIVTGSAPVSGKCVAYLIAAGTTRAGKSRQVINGFCYSAWRFNYVPTTQTRRNYPWIKSNRIVTIERHGQVELGAHLCAESAARLDASTRSTATGLTGE